jgi:hypothetical protein
MTEIKSHAATSRELVNELVDDLIESYATELSMGQEVARLEIDLWEVQELLRQLRHRNQLRKDLRARGGLKSQSTPVKQIFSPVS